LTKLARLVSTLDPLSCWSTALPRVVHFCVILACPQRSQMGSITRLSRYGNRLLKIDIDTASYIESLPLQRGKDSVFISTIMLPGSFYIFKISFVQNSVVKNNINVFSNRSLEFTLFQIFFRKRQFLFSQLSDLDFVPQFKRQLYLFWSQGWYFCTSP